MRLSGPLVAVLLGLASACGSKDGPPAADDKAAEARTEADADEPDTTPEVSTSALPPTRDTDDGGGETGHAAPEVEAHPGPCTITWSSGMTVKLEYDGDGGTVSIDRDGDGKRDMCGKFKLSEGRTKSVSVDLDCDRKSDLTIRPRYAKDANLAEATYSTTVDGEKQKRAVTLVTMPSFSGLDPGYPLPAKRRDIELEIDAERVQKARVKRPNDGRSDLTVEFVYDDDGRIKGVREDEGSDGSVERRFDYAFDDVGNVSGVTAVVGGEANRARLDYSCWSD